MYPKGLKTFPQCKCAQEGGFVMGSEGSRGQWVWDVLVEKGGKGLLLGEVGCSQILGP